VQEDMVEIMRNLGRARGTDKRLVMNEEPLKRSRCASVGVEGGNEINVALLDSRVG